MALLLLALDALSIFPTAGFVPVPVWVGVARDPHPGEPREGLAGVGLHAGSQFWFLHTGAGPLLSWPVHSPAFSTRFHGSLGTAGPFPEELPTQL